MDQRWGQNGGQNPNATAQDPYNYLAPGSIGNTNILGTDVSGQQRQGVADGSWQPFQNYSSGQQAGSLYAPNAIGQTQLEGRAIPESLFGGDTSGGTTPATANAPAGSHPILGMPGVTATANPAPAPKGSIANTQGPIVASQPGSYGGPAAGGLYNGGNGSGSYGGNHLTAAAGQTFGPAAATPPSGLAQGPGPGGFYGTSLSRYLTGQ